MSSNKKVVLIMGKPNTGKSASLRNLTDQPSMVYLNTDLKDLPYVDKFAKNVEVADAMDVLSYIQEIEANPKISGAVLDTLTFLMQMYYRQYVATATDTQKAWGQYGLFYSELIHKIKSGTKNYIILAHEATSLNEQTNQFESVVPVQGAVGKRGVEADFTTILTSKQIPTKKLQDITNDLLVVTPEELEDKHKFVFATRITAESIGDKTRSAMGLWKRNELYIDNDMNKVLTRLNEYYN